MLRLRRCAFTLLLVLAVRPANADTKTVELDATGRLIGVPPPISAGDKIRFKVADAVGGKLRLKYRFEEQITAPSDLPVTGASNFTKEKNGDEVVVTEEVGSAHRMIVYTLFSQGTDADANAKPDEFKKTTLDPASAALAVIDAQLDARRKEAALLQEELKQYVGSGAPGAIDAIERRQAQLRALRPQIDVLVASQKSEKLTVDGLKEELALRTLRVSAHYEVFRVGGLVLGAYRMVVYYHLVRDGSANQPIRLERLSDYPVITRDDELFAAIVDWKYDEKPDRFVLTFNTQAGSAPDPAPVRPSADQPKSAGAQPQRRSDLKDAFVDVILPFGQRFKGNDVIKVTISAYYQAVTTNKTVTTIADGTPATKQEIVAEYTVLKLIDAAEYPQVRALYAYNIATGVVASALRDPIFTKYKTQPQQGPIPARYAVEPFTGNVTAKPVLVFSFYYRPKDIQTPWSPGELVPIPTIGFSLTSAADDFFLGGSSEIRRNVQAIYGYHYGRITARAPIPADDEITDTAPVTRKEFHGNLFAGLSFNINFVKSLFGK